MTNQRAVLWTAGIILALTVFSMGSAFAAGLDNFPGTGLPSGPPDPVDNGTDNSGFGLQAGETKIIPTAGGKTAWWNWTSPITGTAVITTQGSTFDTILGVYTGAAVNSLAAVPNGINDDTPGQGLISTVTISVSAAQNYKIAVDGYNGASGLINLTIVTISNNNFANAITLTKDVLTLGQNMGANKEGGEPSHAGNAGGASIWYTWTSPASPTKVNISTGQSNFDTLLGVYTGSPVNNLTPVVSNNDLVIDGSPQPGAEVTFLPAPNTTYRIAVDGFNGGGGPAQGIVRIIVRDATPPPNDDIANPTVLSGPLPLFANGANIQASREPGEPNHAGNVGPASVWFQWQAPSSGPVAASTQGSTFNTLLAVYTKSGAVPPFGNLNLVKQNDDFGPNTYSRLVFTATAGITYYFAVDGKNGEMGNNINLSLVTPPINDDVANAINLTGSLPISSGGNNQYGSLEPSEIPTIAGQNVNATIWWKWTSPSGGPTPVTVSTANSSIDTLLAVYTDAGAIHPMDTLIVENDNFAGSIWSQVTFTASPSTTYYIAVDGKGNTVGDISLLLTSPPANDNFANALTIGPSVPAIANGTNRFASLEAGEPSIAFATGGSSVWWTWTAPSSGNVTITTANSNFDTLLGVYTGVSVGALSLVVDNNDTPASYQSQVTFSASSGTTYMIAVDGVNGATGFISLAIVTPPANDDFANAIDLGTGSFPLSASGNNNYASFESGEYNPVYGGASVWYSWKATSDGVVGVTTSGSNFNTILGIYTGTAVNSLNYITSGDNTFSSLQAETAFYATNGTTYYIQVDGYAAENGSYTLTLTSPPSNDNFPGTTISGLPASPPAGQSNRFASLEGGEPNHAPNGFFGGASIWYSWTAPGNGKVTITTSGSNFNTLLAVYTGSAVNTLNLVAKNDNSGGTNTSQVTFHAASGTTYAIAVDGLFGDTGNVSLTVKAANAPANDDFANRISIGSTLPVTIHSTNAEATKENGENNHAGQPGGSSVWYSYTATQNGKITISTGGSDFPLIMGLYTGTAVNTLTQVASSTTGQISFNAVNGTSYALAIDGFDGQTGNIVLTVGRPPANDDFANATPLSGAFPITTTGNNFYASKEGGEPDHGGVQGGASVWYSWTAPANGKVTISTAGSDFDTSLAVYVGSNVATLTNVVQTTFSSVQINAVSGVTYKIAVDGAFDFFQHAPSTGNITLTLANKPSNDDFANATPLTTPLPIAVTGSNVGATKENFEPYHGGDYGGASVWYSWTSPISGAITVTTAGSSFNTLLGVYTGNSVNALTFVADNDDFGNNKQAQLTFNASAGTSYRIAVDGFNGQTGSISLGIEKFQKPELSIQSLAITSKNQNPLAGEQVTFTATVKNSGGRTGSFNVAFFLNSATAPTKSTAATSILRVDALLAGATTTLDFAVTAGTVGDYHAWGFADYSDPNGTGKGEADESDETNNAGPTPSGLAWSVVSPPAITSALNANAVQGSAFTYDITASGVAPITFGASNLPDGLTLSGSTISGTPTGFGTFLVTITATNATGTDTQQLTIIIGNKSDQDNDGFSDEIETALGTDPTSAASTPFTSNAPAGNAETLSISSFKLALNPSAGGNDSISVSGFFISSSTSFDGKTIVVDVGGVVKKFTLNAKGQSPKATESIKVTTKNGALNFAAKLTKGTYASSFQDEGLTGTTSTSGIKKVVINVLWGDKMYTKDQFLSAASKAGKVGGSGLGLDKSTGTIQGR